MEMTLVLLLTQKEVEMYQESEEYYREKENPFTQVEWGSRAEQLSWLRKVLQKLRISRKRSSCFATFLFIRKIRTTFGMPRK